MKIDNSTKSTSPVSSNTTTRAVREPSSSSTQATGSGTQVALSGKLDQIVAQTPVVDGAKVNEIKQAIANGQFRVNPEKVADSLIENVRQMLSAQPQSA